MLWPIVAMVVLTAIVWGMMYKRRRSEMRNKGIAPQQVAVNRQAAEKLDNVTAAENFSNLLEIPVLFYLLAVLLLVTESVTDTQLFLAWLFVGLRYVHSAIHVTINHVVSRWFVYLLSTLCLFSMWAIFAFSLAVG